MGECGKAQDNCTAFWRGRACSARVRSRRTCPRRQWIICWRQWSMGCRGVQQGDEGDDDWRRAPYASEE